MPTVPPYTYEINLSPSGFSVWGKEKIKEQLFIAAKLLAIVVLPAGFLHYGLRRVIILQVHGS